MESKLTNYLVKKNLSGTVGDEFMHFLLWGKPRYHVMYLVKLKYFLLKIGYLQICVFKFFFVNGRLYVVMAESFVELFLEMTPYF